MDDARALLDSLMGQTRNLKKDKNQKGRSGEDFKHPDVCKLYLAGFCPENEQLFHNTKRDLGACSKTHFAVDTEEFNAHPEKKRYQEAYELQLCNHLSSILRRCEEWTAREKGKHEAALQTFSGKLPNAEVGKKKDQASRMLEQAEELASKGDFEGSKRMINDAKDREQEAVELEESGSAFPEICEVCGERKDNDKRSAFKHEAGKVHQGILTIKKMYADLKKREGKGEIRVHQDIVDEERDQKDRDAKERRAKERDERERREKERREKQRRDEKEAREREKVNAERAREEEARRREGSPRDARDRRRRDDSRGRRTEDGRGRQRNSDDRRRRDDDVRDRSADRQAEDGRGKRQRTEPAEEAPPPPPPKEEAKEPDTSQSRARKRAMEKKFMDMLVTSGAVNAEATYESLEKVLGGKAEWLDCAETSRRELSGEFIGMVKNMGGE